MVPKNGSGAQNGYQNGYINRSPLLFTTTPTTTVTLNFLYSLRMSASAAALETMLKANCILAVGLVVAILAWSPNPNPNPANCTSIAVKTEKLVAYQVASFSCFIVSTFIALSLKLAINHINVSTLRFWMLLAGLSQVIAFLGLMLVVSFGVDIKFGTLACATGSSFHLLSAGLSLYILLPIALLFYISLLFYFLTR